MRHETTRIDESEMRAALARARRLRAEFFLGLLRAVAQIPFAARRFSLPLGRAGAPHPQAAAHC